MEFVKAKSYRDLFIRCIISSILLNLLFCFKSFFASASTEHLLLELLQICLNVLLGAYIRKKNQTIFLQKPIEKKYVNIILIGFLIWLVLLVEPDIISMPYTSFIVPFYNLTGLDLFHVFDYDSVLVCLAVVFCLRPHRYMAKNN